MSGKRPVKGKLRVKWCKPTSALCRKRDSLSLYWHQRLLHIFFGLPSDTIGDNFIFYLLGGDSWSSVSSDSGEVWCFLWSGVLFSGSGDALGVRWRLWTGLRFLANWLAEGGFLAGDGLEDDLRLRDCLGGALLGLPLCLLAGLLLCCWTERRWWMGLPDWFLRAGGLGLLLLFLTGDGLREGWRLRGALGGEWLRLWLLWCLLCCWCDPRGGGGLSDLRRLAGGLGLLLFLTGDGLREGWRLRGALWGEWLRLRLFWWRLSCWIELRGGFGLSDRRLWTGLGLLWFTGGVALLVCWRFWEGAGCRRCGLRLGLLCWRTLDILDWFCLGGDEVGVLFRLGGVVLLDRWRRLGSGLCDLSLLLLPRDLLMLRLRFICLARVVLWGDLLRTGDGLGLALCFCRLKGAALSEDRFAGFAGGLGVWCGGDCCWPLRREEETPVFPGEDCCFACFKAFLSGLLAEDCPSESESDSDPDELLEELSSELGGVFCLAVRAWLPFLCLSLDTSVFFGGVSLGDLFLSLLSSKGDCDLSVFLTFLTSFGGLSDRCRLEFTRVSSPRLSSAEGERLLCAIFFSLEERLRLSSLGLAARFMRLSDFRLGMLSFCRACLLSSLSRKSLFRAVISVRSGLELDSLRRLSTLSFTSRSRCTGCLSSEGLRTFRCFSFLLASGDLSAKLDQSGLRWRLSGTSFSGDLLLSFSLRWDRKRLSLDWSSGETRATSRRP